MLKFLLLCIGLAGLGWTQQRPALPDVPGKATVQKVCGSCHGAEVVLGRPHSEDSWADIVTKMVQRGAKGSEEELYEVVQYFAANIKALPPIKVNTANPKELEVYLNLNEKEVTDMFKERQKAPFKSIQDLKRVAGIEEKVRAQQHRIEF